MNKTMKIILGGAAGLSAAAFLAAAASAPMKAELQTLTPGTAEVTFTEQGSCTYESSLDVYPTFAGEVQEILVKEGQRVKKGDPLAVLSATDVDYQIQRLETDIKGYNAQIYNLTLSEQKEKEVLQGTRNELLGQLTSLDSQMKGRENAEETRLSQISLQEDIVSQDRTNVHIARQNLRDYRDDYGSDTSDPEYNQFKQDLATAEKSLASSEQRLLELQNCTVEEGYYEGQQESLSAQISSIDTRLGKNYNGAMQSYYYSMIESAKVSIAELTEKQGKATITAPCDGIISALPVEESNSVTQSTVIATVGHNPMVAVFVPVREIDGIQVGDLVNLTVNKRAGDEVRSGSVSKMDSQAQIRLSPLGVEESKIRVMIRTDDKAVGVGYQVDAQFTVYRQENALTVPKKALFQQDGSDCVWVVRDGVAQVQPVVKGVETRGGSIIAEGLVPGDVVVTDANVQGLADGKRVAAQV